MTDRHRVVYHRRQVYPRAFEYCRPESLDEALELLAEHADDARPLAGGMSLIPLLKLRLVAPACLIDVSRLPELVGIGERDDQLSIGAMTRHVDIAESELLGGSFPWLPDAVTGIGDVQVRNAGTIGGSLAHADPAGDWAAISLALGGSIVCRSRNGIRSIPADAFFQGPYTTSLELDELLTEVIVARPGRRSGGAHAKLERRAGDFGIAIASAQVDLMADDRIQKVNIGIGAVAHHVVRAKSAEDLLVGEHPRGEVLRAAAAEVREGVRSAGVISDQRASGEYRLAIVEVLLERVLELAVKRARQTKG